MAYPPGQHETRDVHFRVAGTPITQGSMFAPVAGRVIHVKNDDLNAWRDLIRHRAKEAYKGRPCDGPVRLLLTFSIKRPKTVKKREFPHKRYDLDKLVRASLDAMKGIIFTDDSRVVSIDARKVYGAPGVEVYAWLQESGE